MTLRVRDRAGNESEADGLNVSIFRDDFVPVAQELNSPSGEMASGIVLVSAQRTNQQTATVAIHAKDPDASTSDPSAVGLTDHSNWDGGTTLWYRVGVGPAGAENIGLANWQRVPNEGEFRHTVTLPDTEGDYVVAVEVRDVVGRVWDIGTAQVPVTLDRTVPAPSAVSARQGDVIIQNGQFVKLNATEGQYRIDLTVQVADSEAGLVAECVAGCPAGTPVCTFDENNNCTFAGVAVNAGAQGVFPTEYAVVVVDAAGNRSAPAGLNFIVDHQAPVLTSVRQKTTPEGRSGFVLGDNTAQIEVSAFDPPQSPGLASIVVETLSGPSGDVTNTTVFGPPFKTVADVPVAQVGWNDFRIFVRDGAGNESQKEDLAVFRDENTPEAVAMDDLVGARLVSQNPTNRQTATVEIHVRDADSDALGSRNEWTGGLGTEYRLVVGTEASANIELAQWRPVESAQAFRTTVNLPDEDGNYVVLVQARDVVGRLWNAGTVSVPVVLDRTLPPPFLVTAHQLDRVITQGDVVKLNAENDVYSVDIKVQVPESEQGLKVRCADGCGAVEPCLIGLDNSCTFAGIQLNQVQGNAVSDLSFDSPQKMWPEMNLRHLISDSPLII